MPRIRGTSSACAIWCTSVQTSVSAIVVRLTHLNQGNISKTFQGLLVIAGEGQKTSYISQSPASCIPSTCNQLLLPNFHVASQFKA